MSPQKNSSMKRRAFLALSHNSRLQLSILFHYDASASEMCSNRLCRRHFAWWKEKTPLCSTILIDIKHCPLPVCRNEDFREAMSNHTLCLSFCFNAHCPSHTCTLIKFEWFSSERQTFFYNTLSFCYESIQNHRISETHS